MSRLEKITHVSILAVCAVALYGMADQRVQRRALEKALTPPKPADYMGKALDISNIPRKQGSSKTVVVAIQSRCSHCVASLPFYRRLDELSQEAGSEISLVFLSPEPLETTKAFLSNNGIRGDTILAQDAKWGIKATPTLLVVNSQGIITQATIGELDLQGEQDLLKTLVAKNPA